jgi:hypothetical protein
MPVQLNRAAATVGATGEHDVGVAADTGAADPPGRPRTHALVFLHRQPGSGADWQQVIGRLPAR